MDTSTDHRADSQHRRSALPRGEFSPVGARRGLVDLHCHLLPGVDDGPPTLEAAIRHLAGHAAAGVETVIATPHIRGDFLTDPSGLPEAVAGLEREAHQRGIPISIGCGGELGHRLASALGDDQLQTIAQGPEEDRWLLFELPFTGIDEGVIEAARDLIERGFGLLMAHPERVEGASPGGLRELRDDLGPRCAFQVTAASLSSDLFGLQTRRLALELLTDGLITVVASDSHGARSREKLASTHRWLVEEAGFDSLAADALTSAAPRRLLEEGLGWLGSEPELPDQLGRPLVGAGVGR